MSGREEEKLIATRRPENCRSENPVIGIIPTRGIIRSCAGNKIQIGIITFRMVPLVLLVLLPVISFGRFSLELRHD